MQDTILPSIINWILFCAFIPLGIAVVFFSWYSLASVIKFIFKQEEYKPSPSTLACFLPCGELVEIDSISPPLPDADTEPPAPLTAD